MRRPAIRLLLVLVFVFALGKVVVGVTASNTVPVTKIGELSQTIDADALAPPGCTGSYTTLYTGGGTMTGSGGNDLMLGSDLVDTIDGVGGDDCIVAGDAADTITAGLGNDIVFAGGGSDIANGEGGDDTVHGEEGDDTLDGETGDDTLEGGPGDDSHDGGADTDVCTGGGQPGDTFDASCETQNP